jgi:2-dehydropantoate 2-reductase
MGPAEPRTVAVLGPGGVGGLLAGLLARAGNRVVCLAGPASADALRATGVTVRSGQHGDFTVAVDADTELRAPVDACLVAVKATSLDAALDRVPPQALGDGLVVPLLNGADHMDRLRERYPAEQVVAGAIRVESTRVAPGVIEHGSPFTLLDLASRTVPGRRVEELAAWLADAGLEVTVRDHEAAVLWDKLAFLAPCALLTTYFRAPVGEVRTERRDAMRTVVGEIAEVVRAEGAHTDVDGVFGMFERVPATMKSSMQRDAEAGRPLELDAIGGAVLRAADRHRLAVPVTAGIVAELAGRQDQDS